VLLAKNFDAPDSKRTFEHGEIQSVDLGGVTFSRAVFGPGWRWSTDVAPLAGTERCQAMHLAVVVQGRLAVETGEDETRELRPGDAHVVGPDHDAWVVGDEPCVTLDFEPVPSGTGRLVACPCGVMFQIADDDALDHLVAAVQQHARMSHDHEATREHILAESRAL
jgi:hypothetical protein